MAIDHNSGGIGYVRPGDPTHPTVTPGDTQVIAGTIAARDRELEAKAQAAFEAAEAVRGLAGLGASSPVDAQTAALIKATDTDTRAALMQIIGTTAKALLPLGLRADEMGVKGNGVADDTDAFHAAAAEAVKLGIPLVLPAGMTVGIAASRRLPDHLVLHTNGSVFRQLTQMGRVPIFSFGVHTRVVGGLHVRTLGGDDCQGVTLADAPDCSIDVVDVRSEKPGAGRSGGGGNAATRNNGFRVINSPRTRIDQVWVQNYDWAVWVEESVDVHIGHIDVSTYSLAIRIKGGCSGLRIGSGWTHTAGPNSSYAPGYNGLLMENQTLSDDIRIDNLTVEDAGEHGIRVSGYSTQTNIHFTNCIARNSGGSGFKVLGGDDNENTFRNKNITFTACTAIDSGTINQNCCGFLIQRADGVRLINPVVKRDKQTYSAVEGIRLSGVQNVQVSNPQILDTHKYAIHIDEACGNIQDVLFTNLHIQTPSGHGIYLQNPGVEFRDIRFDGGLVEVYQGEGAGFYAGRYTAPEDSGTWRGMNLLRVTFSESTGATRQISTSSSTTALGSFLAEYVGRSDTTQANTWPLFMGGSTRVDMRLGTRQVYHGGVWTGV